MPGSRTRDLLALFLAMPLLLACGNSRAQANEHVSPVLRPGAIEIGVGGSMTTVEGITHGAVSVRGGYFLNALRGLVGAEAVWGFSHVESLDETELEIALSWQRRFAKSASYPFVSIGGGLRNEEIGSFGDVRYPLGFSIGVRSLVGQRGGFRIEYRYRRVLDDPISDFSEHHITIGLSLFFHNPGNGDV
jgi:hypothetical protein